MRLHNKKFTYGLFSTYINNTIIILVYAYTNESIVNIQNNILDTTTSTPPNTNTPFLSNSTTAESSE